MTRISGIGVLLIGFALFAAFDGAAFYVPLYALALDPNSSTGSFEAAAHALKTFPADPGRDVLVVGDSRIYSGLSPSIAKATAKGRFRFLNGAVPGTTPRCWYYFLNAVDPRIRRFRALVIPTDTYLDSDSAIGSLDGDERQADLHYVVFQVDPLAIPKLAKSFSDMRMQYTIGINMLLRGPIVRDDAQAALGDPVERVRSILQAQQHPLYDPMSAHPLDTTLAGTRIDFVKRTIRYPAGVSSDERSAIANQVLRSHHYSASYARYREEWLYPIVERYVRAGIPVIFVRIPTQPAHDHAEEVPDGSLGALLNSHSAMFLDARPYIALEQPGLFANYDHLNAQGSRLFSEQLGRDVSHVLLENAAASAGTVPKAHREAQSAFGFGRTLKQLIGIGVPLQFQSFEFWVFVCALIALFYASEQRWRRYVLLAASYYFYGRWNGWYVVFLLALTVSDFAIALMLERTFGRTRKLLLAAGVSANLAFLGTFKYANFATATAAALLRMHQDPWLVSWIVPIGISFHTFQSISYLVDVSRGKTPAIRDPIDYALYLAFFPQLLSGPIVRAGLFFGELFHWKPPLPGDISYACMRIGFGLFKKLALADQFGAVSDAYFGGAHSHGSPAAIGAVFAFSMQIFFDFSGYTDIAIGLARLFGFVFPENFDLPYLAASITDFWHRWHMTLSTWLRDYLYIPLGGSRHGTAATLRNLMLTMLLGGLWHGANWTFVAWGGLHGAFLCIERILGVGHARDDVRGTFAFGVRALWTFVLVSLAWVLFRAQTFGVALATYRALFSGGPGPSILGPWCTLLTVAVVLFAFVRVTAGNRLKVTWPRLPGLAQAAILCALMLGVETLSLSGSTATFIYFKF